MKLFPGVYEDLIVRLIILLRTAEDIPAELQGQVVEVVFSPNSAIGLAHTGDLLRAQAAALSWVANFSLYLDEVRGWLRVLAYNEDLSVSLVRRALAPFIDALDAYPEEARRSIGSFLLEMADIPRLTHLWELRMLKRDLGARL